MAEVGFEPTLLDYEPNELPDYSIPQISKKGLEPLCFSITS